MPKSDNPHLDWSREEVRVDNIIKSMNGFGWIRHGPDIGFFLPWKLNLCTHTQPHRMLMPLCAFIFYIIRQKGYDVKNEDTRRRLPLSLSLTGSSSLVFQFFPVHVHTQTTAIASLWNRWQQQEQQHAVGWGFFPYFPKCEIAIRKHRHLKVTQNVSLNMVQH